MGDILFQNTLTGRKEPFVPLRPGEVRMYTCGLTVYDFAHIGNFRTFVFQDILRRFLRMKGYRILQLMNLTDVDDRIIQNAAAAGIGIREYTEKYIRAFLEDTRTLNIQPPEHLARATDHIDDMVRLIQRLSEKSFTYSSDGSIYFRIAKFLGYGKLSKIDLSGIQAGARVDVDRYEKADARDFALWKAPKPGEHFWETSIGPGRPGWHIECSAMSMRYLGETFDIHTGGVDLIFPHHEDEIAQSEAATGKPFVRYWLHAAHLTDATGEKMSKRLKNFATVRDLLAEGYTPRAIRYALLTGAHYRSPLAFSEDLLRQAEGAVRRLDEFVVRLNIAEDATGLPPEDVKRQWDDALSNDLNIQEAVGQLFKFVGGLNTRLDSASVSEAERASAYAMLKHANRILDVIDFPARELEDTITRLIAERKSARDANDFARADAIRDQLKAMGIQLYDTKDGVRWKRL